MKPIVGIVLHANAKSKQAFNAARLLVAPNVNVIYIGYENKDKEFILRRGLRSDTEWREAIVNMSKDFPDSIWGLEDTCFGYKSADVFSMVESSYCGPTETGVTKINGKWYDVRDIIFLPDCYGILQSAVIKTALRDTLHSTELWLVNVVDDTISLVQSIKDTME